MLLEDRLTQLEYAGDHLARAQDILARMGFTGLSNAVLELMDEVGCECANIEMDLEEAE